MTVIAIDLATILFCMPGCRFSNQTQYNYIIHAVIKESKSDLGLDTERERDLLLKPINHISQPSQRHTHQ